MTYIERILIVLNPDGTLKGAHQERLSTDETGMFPAKQHDPEPIDSIALAASISGIRSVATEAAFAAVVAERDSLKAELSGARGAPQRPAWFDISMAQARIAFQQSGLIDKVNAVIADLPDSERSLVQAAWEYSTTVSFDGALISMLWPRLGLSELDKEMLFKSASSIRL